MNNKKVKIWGREFKLPIEYDVFPGETVPTGMEKAAYELLTKHDFDKDLDKLKKYCHKSNAKETDGRLDNIFRFVIPKSCFVRNDKYFPVGLMCDYKFDPEHGIVLVYINNKLIKIGPQDIIL